MQLSEPTEVSSAKKPIDWTRLLEEYHQRRIDLVHEAVIRSQLIPDLSPETSDPDHIVKALTHERVWFGAFQQPEKTALLAFYLFAWGMWKWEFTYENCSIAEAVARAAHGYSQAKNTALSCSGDSVESREVMRYLEREDPIVRLIVSELVTVGQLGAPLDEAPLTGALLLDCIDAQMALDNSSAHALKQRARDIGQRAQHLLEGELSESNGSGGIRVLLREILQLHRDYYCCLEEVADAFLLAVRDGSPAIPVIDQLIVKLRQCQLTIEGDVLASELPPHRHALTALRERLCDESLPALLLESVHVTYIFPFTVDGLTGQAACERAKTFEASAAFENATGEWLTLSGLRPATPRNVLFTDMWTWEGRRDTPLQGSAGVPMPGLTVQVPGEDDAVGDYHVELRFNHLGNHYLRVETALHHPTLSQLNQAIRRPSRYIGREILLCDGRPLAGSDSAIRTVAEYADAVIKDVDTWLNQLGPDGHEPDSSQKLHTVVEVNRDYHTLVDVRTASVRTQNGALRDATGDEVLQAVGPLLMQPVSREPVALEEWMCWRTTEPPPNLLGNTSFLSDLAIGTEHRTILCMLAAPDWVHESYLEVVEFVATLPPVLRHWKVDLDDKVHDIEVMIKAPAADRKPEEYDRLLDKKRSNLQAAMEWLRENRIYLSPSELLRSSRHKTLLTNLYAMPIIADLRNQIDAHLARADIAIQRVTDYESRMHDQRLHNYENMIQWTLLFLSLFSFAGVLALAFQLVYGTNIKGVLHAESQGDALLNLLVVLVLYLLLCVGAVWLTVVARRKYERENSE